MTTIKTNVGRLDQVLRIAVGLLLLALFGAGVIGAWGLIGLVPLGTGMLRFCPAYRVLGISTCSAGAQRLP